MAFPPVLDIGLVAGGIVLLVAGAWLVVEAGSALAQRIGISPLWVGLTVVALGTSLPEATVTVIAALEGAGDLAVTNIVGSNILNILIVLGVTAAISGVPSGGVTMRRHIILVVVAGIALWLLALDGRVHRGEGLLLAALAPVYIVHVYREERRGWVKTPEPPEGFGKLSPTVQGLALAGGFALLIAGGAALVEGATHMAERLGVSDRVIGLTVVAIGTSLPELATSLVAAVRKQVDLALGNLMGSNILNILFALGLAATVRTAQVSLAVLQVDMLLMIASSLLVFRFATTQGRVSRVEGALLIGVYLFYLGYILGQA